MALWLARLVMACYMMAIVAQAGSFINDYVVTWGAHHMQPQKNGAMMDLKLDRSAGSAFQSKKEYIYGRVDMQIKLVPDDSAGTVSTLYWSSVGPTHNEIDFEFLGNISGYPYTIHTNLYLLGKGDREVRFRPWFDATNRYNKYSIVWNTKNIIWLINDLPIRVFKNYTALGVPYPSNQAMKIFSSIWNADPWATWGGLKKTNWTHAPFVASFKNPKISGCVSISGYGDILPKCSYFNSPWWDLDIDSTYQQVLDYVNKNYKIYDYCEDKRRFPNGFPPECYLQ